MRRERDRLGRPMRFGPSKCASCGHTHAGECPDFSIDFEKSFARKTAPSDSDLLAIYRDIFAEITAKATALEFAADDPERITAYRIPCGPLHRAAGKLGFQMFDGEKHLADAVARIRELEAHLAAHQGGTDRGTG